MKRNCFGMVLAIFLITALSACKDDNSTISPTLSSTDTAGINTATDPGTDPSSDTNTAPTATMQAIGGGTYVGSTLTGNYIFSDDDSTDTEGTSTYQWLMC